MSLEPDLAQPETVCAGLINSSMECRAPVEIGLCGYHYKFLMDTTIRANNADVVVGRNEESPPLAAPRAGERDDAVRHMMELRPTPEGRFPILGSFGKASIPWAVAEVAYIAYAVKWKSHQSIETIAHRGGFSVEELDELLPDWRDRMAPHVSGVGPDAALRELLERARRLLFIFGELDGEASVTARDIDAYLALPPSEEPGSATKL